MTSDRDRVEPMGLVMMRCPAAARPFDTGLAMTRAAFDLAVDAGSDVACPLCGGRHLWSRATAWLQIDPGGAPDH